MPVAHTVTQRTLESMRGYFLGVTIVAVFNAVLVGGGALLIGVPLAGTIAVVTFLGAYVPVRRRLERGGLLGPARPRRRRARRRPAGWSIIQLLSNGPFQQIVQPVAYGAALGIHPLAVLVVTIGGRRPVRPRRPDPRRSADLGRGQDRGGPEGRVRRARAQTPAAAPT